MMAEIVDFQKHRLNKFLKNRLGEHEYLRILAKMPNRNICKLLCYSPESKVVFVEPNALAHLINIGDAESLKGLNRILGVIQDAPMELKALLDQDEICPHRRANSDK